MDFNSAIDDFNTKFTGAPKGSTESYDDVNPFKLMLESTISAAGPEMFGLEPSANVEQFREDNTAAGLVSQLIGPGSVYGGVYKLGKTAPVAKYLDKVGDANTFFGGAKRNMALFGGVVEAPRIAGSALLGGDTGEVTEQAAFNTALEGAFGGLGGFFRAAGKATKEELKLGASIDLKQPAPLLAQDIQKSIDEGKIAEAELPTAKNMLARLGEAIRTENPESGKFIGEMLDGDSQPLNRLFKVSAIEKDTGLKKKLFTEGMFDTPQELDDALVSSGLKDNISFVQYPRFLEAAKDGEAKTLEATFKASGLKSVGENTFLGQEKDGLYVVAKKISGEVGIPAAGDRWSLFKTSTPNKFSKNAQQWGDMVAERNAWQVEKPRLVDPNNPLDVLDEVQTLAEALPINGFHQTLKGGGKYLDKMADGLGLDGKSEATRRLRATFMENFAPAMYLYKGSPRAKYVFSVAKTAFQKGESLAHALTYGDEAIAEGKNLYSKLLANATLSGRFGKMKSFAKILEPLTESQLKEFTSAVDSGLEGKALQEAFSKGSISKAAFDALNEVKPLDDYMIAQTKGTMEATGQAKSFSPIKGHYLLPRTWKGDWRVPIKNESGRLVYMASGRTRDAALKEADGILASKEAKGWKRLDAITADSSDDLALATQVATGSPEFMTASALKYQLTKNASTPQAFKVRTGVLGYEKDFTKEELVGKFYNNILARQRYLAELSVNKVLGEQIAKVGLEDAQLARALSRGINAMAGRQGEVGKFLNKEVDKVFAPSLGKNSATKIAGTINELNHHLTLGSLNLAFPVMNMMTFIQTVLPRVAYTLNASDESLASLYTHLPLIGTDGRTRGSFSALEPLKIFKKSMKEMANPDKGLSANFSKALREGVVDPKFVEEWAGQTSKQAMNIKGVLKGEEPFSGFLKSISNYLPSQSEKLSRGNAFTVGHIVGRDVFKLQEDALYRFAKEFTEKTMYNYGAADRPRVFTGPLGTVFGQFKNWSAHYIGNMLEYAGEGFNHNNWAPLVWQMAGTTALGGVSATALYPMAETVNGWISDQSLMENIYERMGGGSGDAMGGNLADGVFMGLPMFAGVSLSGSAADPLSDPSRTASMMFSFVQMNRAMALAKAVGQGMDNWGVAGQHPIDSDATRDLFVSALAPKVMARFVQQGEDQSIKSLNNGNKIFAGLNPAERIMYTTGFMPKRYALAKEVNEELWKDQQELKKKVSTMGRLWSEAALAQDYDMLTELQRTALATGIPLDRVIASSKTQMKNATVPQQDRQFKGADVLRMKSLNIAP